MPAPRASSTQSSLPIGGSSRSSFLFWQEGRRDVDLDR
jgi:hypothetical protein